MSYQRVCPSCSSVLSVVVNRSDEEVLWCHNCGRTPSMVVVTQHFTHYQLIDTDRNRLACTVVGDCALWEDGYADRHQPSSGRPVEADALRVGEVFSDGAGRSAMVVSRAKRSRPLVVALVRLNGRVSLQNYSPEALVTLTQPIQVEGYEDDDGQPAHGW